MPTVKFRPDQPLFKADAFRMPLWVHAPFEIARGFTKWLCVSLAKDNPHRDALHNATFTNAAKKPHRNAFWTGKPVVKSAKWKVMVWRWGLVFSLLAGIKYLPAAGWWWLCRQFGSVLKWVGMDVIPFWWAHLWSTPLFVLGIAIVVWLIAFVRKRSKSVTKQALKKQDDAAFDEPLWAGVVIIVHERTTTFIKGNGVYS